MLEERLGEAVAILSAQRLTEADWRLFTTLVRFDAVYVGHFKCNMRRIADYPNLSGYLRDLYQVPGVADDRDLRHIKAALLPEPHAPSTRPASCRSARRLISGRGDSALVSRPLRIGPESADEPIGSAS